MSWHAGAHRARNPFVIATSLLVLSAALFFWLVPFHGNITRFFRIGVRYHLPPALATAFVYHGEEGYDGQQFLALALDPLASQPATRAALDDPVYRSRRILFPATGFLLAGGDATAVPFILVALNAVAFVLLIALLDRVWADNAKPPDALWPLALAGAWISLLLSTPELIEAALVWGAMLAYRHQRYGGVGLCVCLAMLCRETSAIIFGAFLITSIVKRERPLLVHLLWAWIPPAIWNVDVWRRLRVGGDVLGVDNFSWPLSGFIHAYYRQSTHHLGLMNDINWFVSLGLLVLVAMVFVWRAPAIGRVHLPIALGGLGYVALLCVVGPSVLEAQFGFHRVFLPLYLLCLVGLVITHSRKTALWIFGAHGIVTMAWLVHFGIKDFNWV